MKRKWGLGIVLCMMLILLMPVKAEAANKVHGLVISSREDLGLLLGDHKTIADEMEDALKNNKLPEYDTLKAYIHRMHYNCESQSTKDGTTKEEFLEMVETAFSGSQEGDLNVIFYTGHSIVYNNTYYGLKFNGDGVVSSGIKFSEFLEILTGYKGNYIIIINACHDGALVSQGIESLPTEEWGRFTCMTSADDATDSNGIVFPGLVMKGIGYGDKYTQLPADKNHDGMITTKEIATYAMAQGHFGEERVLFHFEKVNIKKTSEKLYLGKGYKTKTLKYERENSDPSIAKSLSVIKWQSSNKKVATVDDNGKVTAKGEGAATITARLYGPKGEYIGAEDSCKITVKKPSIEIKEVTKGTLYVDKTKKLKAECTGTDEKVTWSSSNKSIATVNSSGTVTAKKAGTITITAKNKEAKDTFKITIYKPSIKLSTKECSITVKKTKTLKATVKGPSQKVTWSSSDKSIATVSSSGKITAKKAGKVTITAKANGVKATCKVTVKNKDYKTLYREFLEEHKSYFTYKDGSYTRSSSAKSFYLLKLNTDKTPELIVSDQDASSFGGYREFHVFTVKSGKVVHCGYMTVRGAGPEISYNTKYKALHTGGWINGIGGAYETLWRVDGKKLKEYKYALEYMDNRGNYKYKTGTSSGTAKSVKKSAMNSFCNKYFNKNNLKSYSVINNTESNRAAKLK